MRKTYIGELEEVALLTVALLYDQAYGVAITHEIKAQTERSISISAVHATLHRLSEKGFVNSQMGGATAERGGRRKRFFTVTPAGSRILHDIQQTREQLWQQIPAQALQWKTI
ncbi:PadR family transcriptional regulator [Tunicatimonas pelagia]|uniref:PadR family transcriptional regulator n=1 Tax=Tunicatimonas pelagia TaxID=931531 RepID=UPI002666ABE6|nr:helix-turn-helix transcriptional regulator [Tunicatimonas pelagia]WKN40685.1 helix-turn-helix transcriptional regulator [Tunicatimonas pelagia]